MTQLTTLRQLVEEAGVVDTEALQVELAQVKGLLKGLRAEATMAMLHYVLMVEGCMGEGAMDLADQCHKQMTKLAKELKKEWVI